MLHAIGMNLNANIGINPSRINVITEGITDAISVISVEKDRQRFPRPFQRQRARLRLSPVESPRTGSPGKEPGMVGAGTS